MMKHLTEVVKQTEDKFTVLFKERDNLQKEVETLRGRRDYLLEQMDELSTKPDKAKQYKETLRASKNTSLELEDTEETLIMIEKQIDQRKDEVSQTIREQVREAENKDLDIVSGDEQVKEDIKEMSNLINKAHQIHVKLSNRERDIMKSKEDIKKALNPYVIAQQKFTTGLYLTSSLSIYGVSGVASNLYEANKFFGNVKEIQKS